LTGLLGFAWNVGAFGGYGLFNLGFNEPAPLVLAGAFSALCFLPAVVVHSAWRAVEKVRRGHSVLIIGSAYGLSGLRQSSILLRNRDEHGTLSAGA